MNKNKKIAVFFDCDNIPFEYVKDILNKINTYGDILISQAYKDWGSSHHQDWNTKISQFNIKQVQITKAIKNKKNTADFDIVIDSIDTVNEKDIDIVVLVSSDSDFRSLSRNLKSKNIEVIGFGNISTHIELRNTYDKFIELPIKNKKLDTNSNEIKSLIDAVNQTRGDSKSVSVAQVGTYIKKEKLSLAPKIFGGKTWGVILKKYPKIFNVYMKDRSTMFVEVLESIQ